MFEDKPPAKESHLMAKRSDGRELVQPVLLALAAAALFGAATPVSKLLLGSISPFQLAGLLYWGAAAGVLPLLIAEQRSGRPLLMPWRMPPRTRPLLLGAVVLGGVVGPVLLLLGLQLAQAASVSLWLNLEAVATALFGYFLFRDRLGRNGWLGAGGILAAALLLTVGEGAAGWQAGLLVAGATTAWALDNHFTALIDEISPAQSTLWKGVVAGSVNLLMGLWISPWQGQWAHVALALLVGVFAYGFSIVFYIHSAQQLGATRSQLLFSTAPYFGMALAVWLLGEPLSGLQLGSALLVGISVLVLTVEWHSHDHEHHVMAHEHAHTHDEHHTHPHEGAVTAGHSHAHTHEAQRHAHRHWPDLHHRH